MLIAKSVSIIFLLLLSAFFSGSETALFSLDALKIRKMQKQNRYTGIISRLLEDPSRLLATILIGNTLVNVGVSSIATSIAIQVLGNRGLGIAIGLMTLLVLIFGEVAPKTLAIQRAEGFSLFVCRPLEYFSRLIFPLRRTLRLVADKIIQTLKVRPEKEPTLTEEELKAMIDLGQKEGVVEAEEREMIRSVLEFTDTTAEEIMTPRVDIKAASQNTSQEEFLKFARQVRHSRIPIYENSIDKIIGVVYTKEVFLSPERSLKELMRPVIFIPGAKKIDDLLKTFDQQRMKIAIVVDEHGGTDGLVTLEDILEEIFGEIYDEFETPERLIERIDDRHFRISGKTSLREVNQELNLELPEATQETVAGLLLELFERIPSKGDQVSIRGLNFSIEKMLGKRISTVILQK